LNKTTHCVGLLRLSLFWLVCAVLCTFLLASFIQVSGVNNSSRARFGDMVYGTAYRPYVTRALVPGIVRGVAALIPASFRGELNAALVGNPVLSLWLTRFRVDNSLAIEAIISWMLMFLSLLGFCAAFRNLLTGVYQIPALTTDLAIFSALLMLLLFIGFGYIYDFTTLFLFSLQYNWMARSRWKAMLISFPLVCLNKETAVLLILVLALYGWNRLPRLTLIRYLVGETAIFTVIWLGIEWIFRANPGSATEFHFQDHFTIARQFPFLMLIVALILIGIAALVVKGWRHKPLFLRWALILLLPMAGLYVFYGFPLEFRAMYEVYPIIFALALPSVARNVHALEVVNTV